MENYKIGKLVFWIKEYFVNGYGMTYARASKEYLQNRSDFDLSDVDIIDVLNVLTLLMHEFGYKVPK